MCKKWTTDTFLKKVMEIHESPSGGSFVFILGAGASKPSGIRTGAELSLIFLEQMYDRKMYGAEFFSNKETWSKNKFNIDLTASDENLRRQMYSMLGEKYTDLFKERYADRENGYRFLAHEMVGKIPSSGYKVLACILKYTRHNIVITTNFDNLVADALTIYASAYPLICGHESLAKFATKGSDFPIIAKIHRDLRLEPHNTPESTQKLATPWKHALEKILSNRIPIFIGYGGNDGSLMTFLSEFSMKNHEKEYFWCYRECDGEPNPSIKELLQKNEGSALVSIDGFDEIMNYGLLQLVGSEPLTKAKENLEIYRKEWNHARQLIVHENLNSGNRWWDWEVDAWANSDIDKKEAAYKNGLKQFPNHPQLLARYAQFMWQMRENPDAAEFLFRHALSVGHGEPDIAGMFASFMLNERHDFEEAEELYRIANEIDPDRSDYLYGIAFCISYRQGRENDSEKWMHDARKKEKIYPNLRPVIDAMGNQEWHKATTKLNKALNELRHNYSSQIYAESLLYCSFVAYIAKDHSNQRELLGKLKTVISGTFPRLAYRPIYFLAMINSRHPGIDRSLFRAIVAAIVDEKERHWLERREDWQNITPIHF